MSERPRLLDLFCGAGGAARGYQRAGFRVVGVDIAPQPRYAGDEFIRADALEYVAAHGREFDAIHASPPCQGYSRLRHLPWLRDKQYPLLIEPTIAALRASGRPWVVENVEDAPLPAAIILCGQTFGLKVYRHRKFEANIGLLCPPHQRHRHVISHGSNINRLNRYDQQEAGGFCVVAGHKTRKATASAAMGIDWMTCAELNEAIPPAYTEFVGHQLLRALRVTA